MASSAVLPKALHKQELSAIFTAGAIKNDILEKERDIIIDL